MVHNRHRTAAAAAAAAAVKSAGCSRTADHAFKL
jgi:hypothetical protein